MLEISNILSWSWKISISRHLDVGEGRGITFNLSGNAASSNVLILDSVIFLC
jgi:hypothetical protein